MAESTVGKAIQLDSEGLWMDASLLGVTGAFNASIFDCHGRRLAGHSFIAPESCERCRWNVDHTAWSNGAYTLVVQGERVLRQTKLLK